MLDKYFKKQRTNYIEVIKMNVCLNCGNNKFEYFGLNKNKQLYCRLCLPFNGESAKKNAERKSGKPTSKNDK